MLSAEKQRRSNIDWHEYLPRHLVPQQISFERCSTAAAMRAIGMKYREIGDAFGVTVERARQMVFKGDRLAKRTKWPTPAEGLYAGKLTEPITSTERRKLKEFFQS
jgi:hypothetical protein